MAPEVMGSPMNERWSGLSKMNWSVGVFVERPAPVKNHWQVLLKPFVGQLVAPGPVPTVVSFSRTRIAIAFWPDSAAKLTEVDQLGLRSQPLFDGKFPQTEPLGPVLPYTIL
jgi:hypothetical protein